MIYIDEYKKILEITKVEAEKVGVTLRLVIRGGRTKAVALARQRAMKRVYDELPLSYAEVGEFFGRDHSTVIFACSKDKRAQSE